MAIDASIYQNLDTRGLMQGLAGIGEAYAQGVESKNRLAQLAQQKELQDLQIQKAKQELGAYPQNKEAQYMQRVAAQIAQAPENKDMILERHALEAPKLGINPENVTWLASDLAKSTDIEDLRMKAYRHAFPQEVAKQELEQAFKKEKTTTPTTLAKLIAERNQIAGANPNAPELAIYDQMITKETTHTPFMQVATGEGGAQYIVQAPKVAGAAPKVTGLGISKPTTGEKIKPEQIAKDAIESNALIGQVESIIPKASSGGISALTAKGANVLGISTDATKANAQLKVLGASLTAKVPKMSGPQSDKDVAMYKEAAGNVANESLPIEDRLAAVQVIKEINNRQIQYAQESGYKLPEKPAVNQGGYSDAEKERRYQEWKARQGR